MGINKWWSRGAYAVQPSSLDNVFFDANSGLLATSTITFPAAATSTCKNMTFAAALNGIGFKIAGTATARFDLTGNATFCTGINFTWIGVWYWYQSSTGAVNTMVTGENTFKNTYFYFQTPSSGTGGNMVVNGNFLFNSGTSAYTYLSLQSISHKVTLNGTSNVLTRYLYLNKGELHEYGYTQNSSPYTYVYNQAKLYNYGTMSLYGLSVDGEAYLNAGNTVAGNVINVANIDEASVTAGYPYILDFNNCKLNVSNLFGFGGGDNTTVIRTINATGSTIHFTPSATNFYFSTHTFNNVIIDEKAMASQADFQLVASGPTTIKTPTIDSLIANRNVYFTYLNGAVGSHLQITGLLRFTPGHIYSRNTVRDEQYVLVGGATLDMQGTCDNTIQLKNLVYDLNGVGTMSLSNLVIGPENNTATGASAPYSAGAGSRIILGTTVSGWTVPPLGSPRTLVWVGGCNATPVTTLPTSPINRSNIDLQGLTFKVTSPMVLSSVDVYLSNSHPTISTWDVRFDIYDSTGTSIANFTTLDIPAASTDIVRTIAFNKYLDTGVYTIRKLFECKYFFAL